MKKLGLSFYDLANPVWFQDEPTRAWGFYGHRRNLYRQTKPHAGFEILRKWISQKPNGGFVFTSNVDGHFQQAGFSVDQVVECHGSINFSQCVLPCCRSIWAAESAAIEVDLETFHATSDLPSCIFCGEIARPNILMFDDYLWIEDRTQEQLRFYKSWLSSLDPGKVAVIEFGAGTAVPTVRYQCEQVARQFHSKLIRINPREAFGRNVLSI